MWIWILLMVIAFAEKGCPADTKCDPKVESEIVTKCTEKFQANDMDKHQIKSDDKNFCCEIHEYLKCVKEVAAMYCPKEEADVAEITFMNDPNISTSLQECAKAGIPATKCLKNGSASHNLSIILIVILFFMVSSKTIYFNAL